MSVMHIDDAVLRRSDGSTAELEGDMIVVRDRHGRDILSVGADGVRLTAVDGDLRLAAPNGKVIIESGEDLDITVAGAFSLRAQQVAQTVGRWELVAERVVQRASDMYQQVDGLVHTQAGRVRRVVEGAHQLIAKRASIACDDDVSIDGHRILLG
jgi:Protein of unknown function (DUF3540)